MATVSQSLQIVFVEWLATFVQRLDMVNIFRRPSAPAGARGMGG
jgi:hypothetical protein